MFFLLSKILWFFLAPLNIAILLICAAMVLVKIGRRKWATWAGAGCCAVLVLFAVLPTGAVITSFLESRYPVPTEMPRKIDGIIMLGGALDGGIGLKRGAPQFESSVDRLTTFANLASRYRNARLVYTSGVGDISQSGTPEGAMAREALAELGFNPGARLMIEDKSRTTYENATLSKVLVQPKPGENWILVTSAWHLPRAVGVFQKQDWPVIPYPSDFRTDGQTIANNGFLNNLTLSHIALKELAGIAIYGLTGKWAWPPTQENPPEAQPRT